MREESSQTTATTTINLAARLATETERRTNYKTVADGIRSRNLLSKKAPVLCHAGFLHWFVARSVATWQCPLILAGCVLTSGKVVEGGAGGLCSSFVHLSFIFLSFTYLFLGCFLAFFFPPSAARLLVHLSFVF